MSAYAAMVEQLVERRVPRDKAEARARELCSDAPPLEIARDPLVLEKAEQHACYKLFRAYGFNVRNLSQARASRQGAGLGDAWVVHRVEPIAFWWETKRQVEGELSPAQVEMRDDCERCVIPYYSGDRYHAAELLVRLELAVAGDGPYGISPAPRELVRLDKYD